MSRAPSVPMRIPSLVLAVAAAGVLAVACRADPPVPPPVGGVEQICVDTMQRPPDHSWVSPYREQKLRGRNVIPVVLGELPSNFGRVVRVAGVLHADFEWVALYPSRTAMNGAFVDGRSRVPWVSLGSLWPEEPYWKTKGPLISDRCVVVEGTYLDGPGGHFAMFNGTIAEVLRLDVWSAPHRPFMSAPVPPPPPAPATAPAP